jgi:hypothetical protein
MENVISRRDVAAWPDLVKGVESFASEQSKKLMTLFRAALGYEREKLHLGNPSAQEEERFVALAKRMIDAAQATKKMASAQDVDELDWLINRLNLSIGILENPMTEQEADEFLAKHFPG